MASLFRLKQIVAEEDRPPEHRLARTLSWPHLVALGVGAIVGTGILTLIGVGADRAGPAVILSFVVAGAICACAALAYAEMATMIPASGSAYTYSYASLGEIVAWVVGWSLLAEYTLVVATVAVGWSGYTHGFLEGIGVHLPAALSHGPRMAGWQVVEWGVNVPALFIVAVVAGLLCVGTRESATINAILVVVKLIALAVFVAVALPYFNAANLEPFSPFGFTKHMGPDGVERGVMAAAAIIFFAFYGFDAISTAAEEAKNPGRDLAIGIVGSMVVCVAIYMVVAVAAVGALSYTRFTNSPEPLALILREVGQPGVATFLAASAVIALPTVILGFLYGQSRIFFVMARDRMLPESLAKVSKRGTPVRITVFTAGVVSFFAAFFPIDEIAALANAGTLTAFAAVGLCLLVMRRRVPDAVRPFRTPAAWVVGLGAIFGCLYLFLSLPHQTQVAFGVWNLLGLVVYFAYARRNAAKGQAMGGWTIGIIGGSGLYDVEGIEGGEWISTESPWGKPSDDCFVGRVGHVRVVFLPRHGRGHRISPSDLNVRANIDVLKRLGVTDVLAISSVGSLAEERAPGTFTIADQFIDRTKGRPSSFFGAGLVAHVSMADPVCPRLSALAADAARAAGATTHAGGTYLAMEGPQFSTRAESHLYRSWGCHIIGMTGMPEAKLAREAELPYALVGMVTDYDCWREGEEAVDVATVIAQLGTNADKARKLVMHLLRNLPEERPASPIDTCLDYALITAPNARDPHLLRKLDAVAGRALSN